MTYFSAVMNFRKGLAKIIEFSELNEIGPVAQRIERQTSDNSSI